MRMTSWFESLRRQFGCVTWAKTPEATEAAVTKDESGNVVGQPVESVLKKAAREAKEAVAAQEAENARLNAIIVRELQNRDPKLGAFGVISDELARAIGKRISGTIKLQIKQFDLFIKDLRANGNLDDVTIRGIKDNLIGGWNAGRERFGLDTATAASFDDAMSDTVDVDVEKVTRGSTPGLGAAITPEMRERNELMEALLKRTAHFRIGKKPTRKEMNER